jgi:hypothetical protein
MRQTKATPRQLRRRKNNRTKIGLNTHTNNDQAAFDVANNRFVAPADGTYLFTSSARRCSTRSTPAPRPTAHGPHARAARAERFD